MLITLAPQVLMEIYKLEPVIMVEADADEVVEEDAVDAAEEAVDATWIDTTAVSENILTAIAGD